MTKEEFAGWWTALVAAIEPGVTAIPHWSAAKGELPGSFVITGIDDRSVRIEGPDHDLYQRIIWHTDFRYVLANWKDYIEGRLLRKVITSQTKHSTYVISIIRWLETK